MKKILPPAELARDERFVRVENSMRFNDPRLRAGGARPQRGMDPARPEAPDAARSLIADLTGLPAESISCDIQLRRSPGMLGGSTPLA